MKWIAVITISLLSTFNTLILKSIQKRYINNRTDFFIFIFYLNFFQSIGLLAIPPYTKLSFFKESLYLGIAYGVTILVYYLFMMLALSAGPLVLTNSVLALYPLIPIFYGLLFWQETLSILIIIGLALFIYSIFNLTNATYYDQKTEKKIELRWLIFVLIAFLCSGATSVFAKQHAIIRPDNSREYLLVCRWVNMLISGLLCLIARKKCAAVSHKKQSEKMYFSVLSTDKERTQCSSHLDILNPNRFFLLFCFLNGVLMAVANTIFMQVVTRYASAFFFPTTQALSIIFTFFFSRIIFKEFLSKEALKGYILIIAAVILISIG
jgi:drug/metabolite transporter (DMT)-like permease